MDPIVAAAIVAAVGSLLTTILTLWDRNKVKQTHTAVTQNGGKNSPPTVLDGLHDIKTDIRDIKDAQIAQGAKLDAHIMWHLSNNKEQS